MEVMTKEADKILKSIGKKQAKETFKLTGKLK